MSLRLARRQRINGQVGGPITVKHYSIKFPNTSLDVTTPWQNNMMEGVTPKIEWDEAVTTINQAIFRCTAHGYAGLGGGSMSVGWEFNGNLVITRNDLGPCNELGNPEGTNVGAYLINGEANTTRIRIVRRYGFSVGIESISADLEVWFQGKEPKVTYPEPEWLKYVKYGLVAAGILGAVYVGIRLYEARKKG